MRSEKRVRPFVRISVAGVATLGTLLALEAGLRLASTAARWAHRPPTATARERGVLRVLCVGESTTAKIVPDDISWPAQLPAALARLGVRAETINVAVAGTHTGRLVERLPRQLAEYKPDVVVAMAGINDNYWFAVGAARSEAGFRLAKVAGWVYHSLRGDRPAPPRAPETAGRWKKRVMDVDPPGLHGSACWKRLRKGGEAAFPCALAAARAGVRAPGLYGETALSLIHLDTPASRRRAGELMASARPLKLVHSRLMEAEAALARLDGRDQDAERWLRRALDQAPSAGWIYADLIEMLGRNGQHAAAWAVFGMFRAAAPVDARPLIAMQKLCLETRDEACASALADELLALMGTPSPGVRTENAKADTVRTLRRMAELANEAGAAYVAMQYPRMDPRQLSAVYAGLRVHVVSNADNFEQALSKGRFEDYFVDRFRGYWGHATAAGNRLIAERLADELVAKGLAKPKKP